MMRRLSMQDQQFWQDMDSLLAWESVSDERVEKTVKDIIHAIRTEGDAALIRFTNQFDRRHIVDASELEIPKARLQAAFEGLASEGQQALMTASDS
jgi:histidinol dehydrogenase